MNFARVDFSAPNTSYYLGLAEGRALKQERSENKIFVDLAILHDIKVESSMDGFVIRLSRREGMVVQGHWLPERCYG